ncbi:hypothetical protein [Saccharopolyspora phatthalungensis]|uniref:Uncharacterized protein n=1 Tax=Saccharopolyspora phatthalungensis TaxID=664693 RepID=A0A840QBL1_9PSEU|nr:hypothetical protein [Saccharopolyspora phatthalungensis]MBB5157327.1 hypothetical protein [Saccharopolyspora phatthalungensis]
MNVVVLISMCAMRIPAEPSGALDRESVVAVLDEVRSTTGRSRKQNSARQGDSHGMGTERATGHYGARQRLL